MSVRIRSSESMDVPFLRQMLYEAAYWRGGIRPDLEAGLSDRLNSASCLPNGDEMETWQWLPKRHRKKPVGAAWASVLE